MRLIGILSLLLLIGLAAAAPKHDKSKESKESKENKESKESGESEHITVTKEFFPEEFVVYTAKHDIVNILVPINSFNFEDDEEDDDTKDDDVTLFFVEADKDSKGNRIDKGLYVLKNHKAKKLLENGRDAAASSDDSKEVYFAAKDGIYAYNKNDSTAVKYGSVTDSVIGIAKENSTDLIYILTEDYDVYKVTESGHKKEKIDGIVGAREIVLDNSNNLFYYGEDKVPFVYDGETVTRIQGLPEHPKAVRLLKPPFILEDSVPFVSDNVLYIIYANGTSEKSDFDFKSNAMPSAYAPEATLIQYYAYKKKIYEYNLLVMVLGVVIEDLKEFLETKSSDIQTLSTKSRSRVRVSH